MDYWNGIAQYARNGHGLDIQAPKFRFRLQSLYRLDLWDF